MPHTSRIKCVLKIFNVSHPDNTTNHSTVFGQKLLNQRNDIFLKSYEIPKHISINTDTFVLRLILRSQRIVNGKTAQMKSVNIEIAVERGEISIIHAYVGEPQVQTCRNVCYVNQRVHWHTLCSRSKFWVAVSLDRLTLHKQHYYESRCGECQENDICNEGHSEPFSKRIDTK